MKSRTETDSSPYHSCPVGRTTNLAASLTTNMPAIKTINRMFSQRIGQAAVRALLEDALLFPKPGLVDPSHPGAHRDMDLTTLLRSAFSLEEYFTHCARTGLDARNDPDILKAPDLIFPVLRSAGQEAERRMFVATGGINTHKGAIFSLGLLSAACGMLIPVPPAGREPPAALHSLTESNTESLCLLAGSIAKGIVRRDLERILRQKPESHGEAVYLSLGSKGIRGEAESGFPTLRTLVFPVLVLSGPHAALLASMSVLEDSCILSRGGPEALARVRDISGKVYHEFFGTLSPHESFPMTVPGMHSGTLPIPVPIPLSPGGPDSVIEVMTASISSPRLLGALLDLDREFVSRNLSPGGSADMLACAFFLSRV